MRRWIPALLALLAAAMLVPLGPAAPARALAGPCGPVPPARTPIAEPTSVFYTRTIRAGGLTRSYDVYRPARVALCSAPLVIALHGIGVTARQFEALTLLSAEAEQQGFIVIFPESAKPDNSWNAGFYRCCGQAAAAGVNDTAFIRAIVQQAKSDYLVDPRYVFVTGHSNGAALTYQLACTSADIFSAAAPVAYYYDPYCYPARPVSILHIHGAADPVVRFPGLTIPGMWMWRKLDGCSGSVAGTVAGAVTHITFGVHCSRATTVQLYVVRGMAHDWPAPWTVWDSGATQLNGTDLVWQFFAAHPRR